MERSADAGAGGGRSVLSELGSVHEDEPKRVALGYGARMKRRWLKEGAIVSASGLARASAYRSSTAFSPRGAPGEETTLVCESGRLAAKPCLAGCDSGVCP